MLIPKLDLFTVSLGAIRYVCIWIASVILSFCCHLVLFLLVLGLILIFLFLCLCLCTFILKLLSWFIVWFYFWSLSYISLLFSALTCVLLAIIPQCIYSPVFPQFSVWFLSIEFSVSRALVLFLDSWPLPFSLISYYYDVQHVNGLCI